MGSPPGARYETDCQATETNGKKRDPRRHTKDDEGTRSGTALPHRQGQCLLAEQEGWEEAPLRGARASRPHPLRWVAARFPRDAAPGHPAGGNPMGSAEVESWRRCRSSLGGRDGRGCASVVRAGRPRSRVGASSRDVVAAKQVHGYSAYSVVRLNDPHDAARAGLVGSGSLGRSVTGFPFFPFENRDSPTLQKPVEPRGSRGYTIGPGHKRVRNP